MGSTPPLILVTNDDGIGSPGLRAAVGAVLPLGDVLVVAPKHQQSGAARSLPIDRGVTEEVTWAEPRNHEVTAFTVDGSPALAVRSAILLHAPRMPALVVSGINYGENVGVGITISGTVGAALEAAATFGVPALAVSLQTRVEDHLSHNDNVDFTTAAFFTRRFAEIALRQPLPPDVDILKIEIPSTATPETPWHVTRVSRRPYFYSIVKEKSGRRDIEGYEPRVDKDLLEPDSDVWALVMDRVISVSPLSVDLTSATDRPSLDALLRSGLAQP